MFNVAVAGATGAVGREMLSILAERDFPVDNFTALASHRSEGKKLPFGDDTVEVQVLSDYDFSDVDLVLFSAGSGVVSEEADRILDQGTVIVDNSSAFRYQPDVPLVVPEINPGDLEDHSGLIANPNCSTTQLVMVLAPVHEQFGIDRVVVSTYQSTSGAGGSARRELYESTKAYVNDAEEPEPGEFPHPIAFDCMPLIGDVLDDEDDYTKEEMKMLWETRKIIGDDSIRVSPTAVRVPVLNCHGESVNVETTSACSPGEVRELLSEFPNLTVLDDPRQDVFPTMREADGKDETYVGRIRSDFSVDSGFNCWIVSDNLRKGAALNTVQIAEELVERDLL